MALSSIDIANSPVLAAGRALTALRFDGVDDYALVRDFQVGAPPRSRRSYFPPTCFPPAPARKVDLSMSSCGSPELSMPGFHTGPPSQRDDSVRVGESPPPQNLQPHLEPRMGQLGLESLR